MHAMQAADLTQAALAGASRRLMTKSAYARLRGISPARVSQWIAEGKIAGDAIVGEGMRAQIDVDVANAQLGASLDLTQQLAQQRPVAPESLPLNNEQKRLALAKAESAEIAARQARRAEAEQAGVYVRAEDVRRAWSRDLGELMTAIDSWMIDAAGALARDLGIDQKQATVLLRKEWRAFRVRRADLARGVAEDLPQLVEENQAENG